MFLIDTVIRLLAERSSTQWGSLLCGEVISTIFFAIPNVRVLAVVLCLEGDLAGREFPL